MYELSSTPYWTSHNKRAISREGEEVTPASSTNDDWSARMDTDASGDCFWVVVV